MPVKLQNTTKRPRRMLVLNLTKVIAPVTITNTTTEESAQGERRQRVAKKIVPDSIRVPVGGESELLHEDCLLAPEVQKAIANREVRVVEVPVVPETQTPAVSDATEKSPKPRRIKNDTGGNA